MTALPQIKADATKAEAGARLLLVQSDLGWTLQSGRAELYLVAAEDGNATSHRHFLFEIKTGGMVLPLLHKLDGFQLVLIATEACSLVPLSVETMQATAEHADNRTKLAEGIDQWIAGLSSAVAVSVGAAPDGACAIAPGDTLDCQDKAAVTVRSGVGWIAGTNVELEYCDGSAVATASVPITPGTWVVAKAAGPLTASATRDVLATRGWPHALRDLHRSAFAAIGRTIGQRYEDLERRITEQAQSGERLADRVVGSFHRVAKSSRRAWQTDAHEDERLLAVFMVVAGAVGLDIPQREQDKIAKAATVDEAVRNARLRQRQVALRGNWWREDLGPLIGFMDDERRVVALLPTGGNRWEVIDPVKGTAEIVDAAIAARIAPTAHMLYPVLPDKPLTFKEFMKFGAERSNRDLLIAIAAALAGAALGLATPLAMRLAFDRFIPGHNSVQLVELAIGLMLAALISTLFRIAYDQAALRIDGRAAGSYAAAIMDRVLRLPEAALRFGSADLSLRFGSADQLRRTITNVMLSSIPAIFLTLFNGALMFYYAPWAAAVAVASFLLLCGLSALFAGLQREAQKRGEQLTSDIFNIVFQLVQAIGVLRTSGAEVRAFAHWGVDFAELRARSYRARKLQTVFETLLSGIDLLSLAGIFLLLALLPATNFTTGAFIAFVTAYGMFAGNSMQIVRNVGTLIGLDVTWERAAPLLRSVPERSAQRRDPGRLTGKVDITNVAFRYSPDAPLALGGVSLQAAAGEFVAVVGPSGSGKSTLVRLLLGLDQPLQGTVQYDGQDLRHLDTELVRRQIGVVLQTGRLFPGTLFENIMGSFPGAAEDAWEAARQAGVEDDIRALPMGLHTLVTEASAAFSGGQVQRLIIARALVGKPRILIFDEATSALDNVTQAIVTKSVSQLAVTRIVIAHRLTTVQQADRIYVLDKGRIAQNGKYDDLVKTPGPFADFARKQLV